MMTAEMKTYEYLKARLDSGESVSPERIVCAANLLGDGSVVLGVRHGCEVMHAQAKAMGVESLAGTKQGFYTSWQRWVDRKEAMRIARAQVQVLRPEGTNDPETLFSECLY